MIITTFKCPRSCYAYIFGIIFFFYTIENSFAGKSGASTTDKYDPGNFDKRRSRSARAGQKRSEGARNSE